MQVLLHYFLTDFDEYGCEAIQTQSFVQLHFIERNLYFFSRNFSFQLMIILKEILEGIASKNLVSQNGRRQLLLYL